MSMKVLEHFRVKKPTLTICFQDVLRTLFNTDMQNVARQNDLIKHEENDLIKHEAHGLKDCIFWRKMSFVFLVQPR